MNSKETELYEHEQYNKQHQFGHIHSKIPNKISGSSKKILFSRLSNINCNMQILRSSKHTTCRTTYSDIHIYVLIHWYQDATLLMVNLKHNNVKCTHAVAHDELSRRNIKLFVCYSLIHVCLDMMYTFCIVWLTMLT